MRLYSVQTWCSRKGRSPHVSDILGRRQKPLWPGERFMEGLWNMVARSPRGWRPRSAESHRSPKSLSVGLHFIFVFNYALPPASSGRCLIEAPASLNRLTEEKNKVKTDLAIPSWLPHTSKSFNCAQIGDVYTCTCTPSTAPEKTNTHTHANTSTSVAGNLWV